jgi:hypothetical protein
VLALVLGIAYWRAASLEAHGPAASAGLSELHAADEHVPDAARRGQEVALLVVLGQDAEQRPEAVGAALLRQARDLRGPLVELPTPPRAASSAAKRSAAVANAASSGC